MKTLVIYDSAFGNTQKIAEAIGAGLNQAEVRHVGEVKPEDLAEVDCLVVGSPTQSMNYVEGMKNFLNSIPEKALKGKHIAAFDTRILINAIKSRGARFAMRVFLHRYAAEPIAQVLKAKGGTEIINPEGFFVLDTEGPLKDGELERAEAWGQQIGQMVRA